MLFGKIRLGLATLAFRLTVYYTALFTLSALVALLVIYMLISHTLGARVDEDLREDIEEYAQILAQKSPSELQDELNDEAATEDPHDFFFRLISAQGELLLSSDLGPWPGLEAPQDVVTLIETSSGSALRTADFPGQEHPARIIYAKLAPGFYLQMAESSADNSELLEIIVSVFLQTLLLILVLGGGTGWVMARRSLAGMEEVTQTARQISKGDFSRRVPLKSRGREIERLATTFNVMLDRIHALITGIREVTDNIAHDLRSPITSIRGNAETTLLNSSELAEYQNMAGNTVEECDRLLGMINAMLDISEAEAGAEKLELEQIDLSAVASQACEIFQPLAEERNLALLLEAPGQCHILGDTRKVQRLISNLIDNALKYTAPGGRVLVSVRSSDKDVELRVEDNGSGIAEVDLPHIFKRFYRCDKSRSQEGTGLGLSLARAIAQAHCGTLEVQSEPGRGSSFFLTIPRAAF